MTREKTIGFVTFAKEGKAIEYLLLHHGGEYWNFPKGRVEAGESELQTAKRELQEETGITEITVVDGFRSTYDYDFDSEILNGERRIIHKEAIFYLGQVQRSDVQISNEHLDFGWFPYEVALRRLYYQNGQNILKKAHQFLLAKQDFVL